MKLRHTLSLLSAFAFAAAPAAAAEAVKDSKAALQTLNEFIGDWKGTGASKTGKAEDWKESMVWSWKIKGDDIALVFKGEGGKQFSTGTLTYLPKEKKYQLTTTDADKKERVFVGEIKVKKLVLTAQDAETKDKFTIEMSTNNDGVRFVYNVAKQNKGVGIARKLVEVGLTKEGASLAGGKKNECIVTGGLGTMAVSFNGKTYYVCCSGCRDEFNENPKKYINEYEKKKK